MPLKNTKRGGIVAIENGEWIMRGLDWDDPARVQSWEELVDWIDEIGWVDNVIYFDGNTWKLMDPTFASNGHRSDAIMKYIGDGSNYKTRFSY